MLVSSPLLARRAASDMVLFFDRMCINQGDAAMKSEGITSLAGFLDNSSELLVLFVPEMLDRMWCVFELAIFAALGKGKISWCPIFLHSVLLIQFAAFMFYAALRSLEAWLPASEMTVESLVFLPAILGLILLNFQCRLAMTARDEARRKLASFSLGDAKCRDPSDAEDIRRIIGRVHASEDGFNAFVRETLGGQVGLALRGSGATYPNMLLAASPLLTWKAQSIAACARAALPWRDQAAELCVASALCLLAAPATLKTIWMAAEWLPRRRGAKAEVLLCALLSVVQIGVSAAVGDRAGLFALRHGLLASGVFLLVWAVCACFVFCRCPPLDIPAPP